MRRVLSSMRTLLPLGSRWGVSRRERALCRQRALLRGTALSCAVDRGWPVLPGVAADGAGCGCPRPDCPTPGAHPYDPPLLAATADVRMVRWWWQQSPDAPVLLATGQTVSAVSLPAAAGARALEYFDTLRIRTGPVLATPTRFVLLVAPYSMDELAELLIAQEWVPTSLRYHGSGGYVVLPPSSTAAGGVRWVRGGEPVTAPGTGPWLPTVQELMGALVAASAAQPDGARLSF